MITPEAIEMLNDMPVSQKPIWLNPLSMDPATNREWDDGKHDEVRTLLAQKTGSVGIRFVQPSSQWGRMGLVANVAREVNATICLSLFPWKANDKNAPPFFAEPYSERNAKRLEYLRTLAKAWHKEIGDTPTVILLDHELPSWRDANVDDVRARLMEVRDVLATELPGEKSWYNNRQRQPGGGTWPFIPSGFDGNKACSLYFTDVLRAAGTFNATCYERDVSTMTTWHTFDKAWAYENAAVPWGKRTDNPLPFTGERAEIYHRAVGRMVRNCHARVAYEPRMTVDWLTGLRAFIEGMDNG